MSDKRESRVVDNTGCDHVFEPHDVQHEHRLKCSKCGVFAHLAPRHARKGEKPKIYCCSYTRMVDTTAGEKRRPGCNCPARAWYNDAPFCEEHVPKPRGQAEENRRREVESKRDEDHKRALEEFERNKDKPVGPSNLTHFDDDHMIVHDRHGNVASIPDPLDF